MCTICKDKVATVNLITNVDPTHTLTTRRRFVADMEKRFAALKKEVREHIEAGALLKRDNADFVILRTNATVAEWRSRYDPDRIPEFLEWLEQQNNKFILSKSGTGIQVFPSQTTPLFPGQASFHAKTETTTRVLGGVEGRWTDVHIRSAYQKGVQQARAKLRKGGLDLPAFESTEAGLGGIFNAPFHVDRVQLAFTQTFSGLQGITKAMEAPLSQALALGMAEGRSPKEIARNITATIDKIGLNRAKTLARTEVIRAHHGASIAEFRAAGIEGVIVKAEWLTAGDNRVCPRCEGNEGQIFTLDEIEPMIPLHPNCRCVAIPIVPTGKRGQVIKSTKETILERATWVDTKTPEEFSKAMSSKFGIKNIAYGVGSREKIFNKTKVSLNYIGRELEQITLRSPALKTMITKKPLDTLSLLDAKTIKKGTSLAGAYSPSNNKIWLSNKSKLIKGTRSIKEQLELGKWNVGQESLGGIFRHEVGHFIYDKSLGTRRGTWNALFSRKSKDWWRGKVSIYGGTNAKEAFAESFAAFNSPLHNTGQTINTLPDEVLTLFNRWFK